MTDGWTWLLHDPSHLLTATSPLQILCSRPNSSNSSETTSTVETVKTRLFVFTFDQVYVRHERLASLFRYLGNWRDIGDVHEAEEDFVIHPRWSSGFTVAVLGGGLFLYCRRRRGCAPINPSQIGEGHVRALLTNFNCRGWRPLTSEPPTGPTRVGALTKKPPIGGKCQIGTWTIQTLSSIFPHGICPRKGKANKKKNMHSSADVRSVAANTMHMRSEIFTLWHIHFAYNMILVVFLFEPDEPKANQSR